MPNASQHGHDRRDVPPERLNRGRRLVPAAISVVLGVAGGCADRSTSEHAVRPADSRAVTRVIALAPNAAEILCALGVCDALVGVSRFCTYPPELSGVPKIGGLRDPDLETVLALRPDLVILRGRGHALRELCRDRGIRVYDDRVETLDDLYQTIRELGELFHRAPQAGALIDEIRSGLRDIAVRVAGAGRPRVLFTLRSPSTLADVLTTGRGTFISELITIAGGANVFGDQDTRYPSVSVEEIVGRNPEVIIEAMTSQVITPALRATLTNQWRALPPIAAVRAGRVHFVSDDYLTIPSHRVTLAAQRFVALIHPELTAGE